MVGRAAERAVVDETLRARTGALVIEGEPGIGKSCLLEYAAAAARAAGATVLAGRATEYEGDLPFGPWREALEAHLAELGDRRVARLGLEDPEALAALVPALGPAAGADRHRVHRALRDLLARLAAARPLVVCLDDVHWADPASLDALAALVLRPPDGPVVLLAAARENQVPRGLAGARRVVLGPLSEREAAELLGGAPAAYAVAGGNPFYLEQLARVGGDAAVATAVEAELAGLAPRARALLEAGAVAGDPFELDLAAAVAALDDPHDALDELLAAALARPTDAPRRFAFRHPIVRHAVYSAIPAGRRLRAHARAAGVLRERGAGPVELAHHVEHAAVPGDADAVALLSTAAGLLRPTAPGSAARFYAAAARLQPSTDLRWRLADAQAAAGDPAAARETLVAALEAPPADARLALTVAIANADWALGNNDDARRRLQVALAALPAAPSPDRIRLRLALTITALAAGELADAEANSGDARDDARAIGDRVFEAAALASGAVAVAEQARAGDAEAALAESVAALERLTPAELATRQPALWMHGRVRRLLGRPAEALADLDRAGALAERTGRESQLAPLALERAAALAELGRLAEAEDAAREGGERAELLGHRGHLAWARCLQAFVRLATGRPDPALTQATLATDPGLAGAGLPGWCHGATLTALGRPAEAAQAIAAALPRLLPADRPAALADLVEAHLAAGDAPGAEAALDGAAEAGSAAGAGNGGGAPRGAASPGAAWVAVATASLRLAQGDSAGAVRAAARALADAGELPMLAAHARLAAGRALAAGGDRSAAVEALTAAEAAFSTFGARRRRDEATRELRRLGRRVVRPAESGDGPLTAREREIADLVAAGLTNREIAARLVLSTRTIEAHLRTIYAKLGVRSRVELTRMVNT